MKIATLSPPNQNPPFYNSHTNKTKPTTTPIIPVPLATNAIDLTDPLANDVDDGLKSCIVLVSTAAVDVVGVTTGE